MENIISLFKKNHNVESLISKTKGLNYSLFCNGVTPHHGALVAATLFQENNNFIIYVCENTYLANKMYDHISNILGYEKVNLYLVDDVVVTESVIVNNELKQERINTIKSIINKRLRAFDPKEGGRPIPSEHHYRMRLETRLGLTAPRFYALAQKSPLEEVLNGTDIEYGEIIEIDDGLKPYYFYYHSSTNIIPVFFNRKWCKQEVDA